MSARRIAILGAGAAGVCAALELARRGHAVDLYEAETQPVTRASVNNEGKVHLGLVYAKDASMATARTMVLGAVHFASCLRRWIDLHPDDACVSTPFYYAVHKGTMVATDELAAHYARCRALLEDACASTGLSYLGADRTLRADPMPADEIDTIVDPAHVESVFRTSERAVDPRVIAVRLREAVAASGRITFIGRVRVSGAARVAGDRIRVSFRSDGVEHAETYDQVANTLWHGRLGVDATMGLKPPRRWIYRYKVGGWLPLPLDRARVPSLTLVLGPYGDVVNFGQRGLYFSWYPAGMIGTSLELTPPEEFARLEDADRSVILRNSFEEMARRCRPLGTLPYSDEIVQAAAGIIFAWGHSDIDEADSRLHTRHEIGIHSTGGYHSVNTGKYTMAPYLGYKTAERILGLG